ncbi:type IV pilus modification PilV family protein [Singulisphaera sp. PoT]|uniref:type IV pilus modification PilV family protein n=1 Tax=Singulisphaera sp. PoT TaxID=3411797 RepID=UPI003BF5FAF8
MIRQSPRARAGITLTEILISILIMGVGIISLATLFPLGLLRLRDAARLSRSSYLTESATADLNIRNLLNKQSFTNPYLSPWYNNGTIVYDPWIQDTLTYGVLASGMDSGVIRTAGPGLPVAYDPLWRFQTGIYADGTMPEARFGSGFWTTPTGVNVLRPDPDGNDPSAHGLPRVTNFNPLLINPNTVPDTFVSPEDIVWQQGDTSTGSNDSGLSPVIPELTTVNTIPVANIDWRYTWMFTGHQSDATDGAIFEGSVVIFENRPFAIDNGVVAGEPVVEAVFGYSTNVRRVSTTQGTLGYGAAASRVVLLRWPASLPDPDIRVGNWIADVTYERSSNLDASRRIFTLNTDILTSPAYLSGIGTFFPYQRCYWYQIVKRTTTAPAEAFTGDTEAYRSMTVWVHTDLKAQTLLNASATPIQPAHMNAALISPNVINVFPRTIYTR